MKKLMAFLSKFKCNNCGNEFEAKYGDTRIFIEFRCVDCDNVKYIKRDIYRLKKEIAILEIGVCENCGGEFKRDLKPMCPVCKSRDVEEKEILVIFD